MKLARLPDCHLSYCTNIHPGESWVDVEQALKHHLPAIRRRVHPDGAMGVGLRLSALAARELEEDSQRLQAFRAWLDLENLYVYTVNGFPYGPFHGRTVKEQVYRPDWAEPERLDYSRRLARILAGLLPDGLHGSVSTVPVGFKPDFADVTRLHRAIDHLLQLVAYLAELEHDSGQRIQYALEPEPGCCLELTRDLVDFFHRHLLTEQAAGRLRDCLPRALAAKVDAEFIKRYLGVCLDTCHAAVMFEKPAAMLKTLNKAGVPVHKIQLTAALSVNALTPALKEQLARFADDVYLHQTSVRAGSDTGRFFLDLDSALSEAADGAELRSHFHVPVFAEHLGDLSTTQNELVDFLTDFQQEPCCRHLEVETYTFSVLPAELREHSVVANVSRELNWVRQRMDS